VTIPAGRDSVVLVIRPVDRPAAASEFVSVMLGNVDGYNFDRRAASVAIQDNGDSAPPVYSPVSIVAGRGNAVAGRAGSFVVMRGGDTSGVLTVPIGVGGTAVNGVDFGRIGQTITFLPGQSTVTVPVRTVGGLVGDRTVDLSFAELPGAVPNAATVNISGATTTGGSTTTGGIGSGVGTDTGTGGSLGGLPGGSLGSSGGTTTGTVTGNPPTVVDEAGRPIPTVPTTSVPTGSGDFSTVPGAVPTRGSVPVGTGTNGNAGTTGTGTAGTRTGFSSTPIGNGTGSNSDVLIETNLGSSTSTPGFGGAAFNSGTRITDDSTVTA
jgi:hypothetical protein